MESSKELTSQQIEKSTHGHERWIPCNFDASIFFQEPANCICTHRLQWHQTEYNDEEHCLASSDNKML
jgi:hypothetical protein